MVAAEAVSLPTPDERITAALWFAGHGFGIFPVWSTRDGRCRCPLGGNCTSPGKHPITPNGFKDATQDPHRIRTFLSAASNPNYGMFPPEGVFIWDVDTDDERARIATLEARYGPLPPTVRVDTGKGQHLFFRWPEGVPRPVHHTFGLITRWGSGSGQGYVVGPKSVHVSGRVYHSAPDSAGEIATLPEAWARAAVDGDPGTLSFKASVGDAASVQVGGRHEYLRNTARFYAGTLRDPDVLFAAVWAENLKFGQPKTREEVQRAIGEALTKFPADEVEQDPETGETRRVPDEGLGLLPRAEGEEFPPEPDRAAFGGLIGEAIAAITPGTDASEVAMLTAMLAFCGALVPGSAYFNRVQTTSPYLAIVGESTFGRKGTAMYRVQDAIGMAIGVDKVNRVKLDGVASGEALVSSLHDRQESDLDRTGLIFEEEYATHLAAQGREGSTLDPRMRQAFDGAQMHHRKVSGTIHVKEPFWLAALIAITPHELRSKLPGGALLSGSGNRWLWVPVRRRDVREPSIEPRFPVDIAVALAEARRAAMDKPFRLTVDPEVGSTLSDYSEHIRSGSVGIAADMTRRFPVIAFRLALIHASVERSATVTLEYLQRAIALTEYARAGMGWIFGQSLGNRDATLLLRYLQENGTVPAHLISRHMIRDPIRRQDAIDELDRLGLARVARTVTRGRPRTELTATVAGRGAFAPFVTLSGVGTDWRGRLDGQNVQKRSDGRSEGGEKWGEDAESSHSVEQAFDKAQSRRDAIDKINRSLKENGDAAGDD